MKKIFLLGVFTVTFSYAQVTDENGSVASNSGGTNLTGNIGIGVMPSSSSTYKLEVNGVGRFSSDLLIGDPLGARTEIKENLNHKIYAPTNIRTINLDGNYQGGGYVGVYRADVGLRGVYMQSQPDLNHNDLVIREMRGDANQIDAVKLSSTIFTGDTTPTNFIELPSQNSTIVIGELGDYKKGQGYGLINRLKTNFENDVYVETGNVGIGTNSFVDGSDTYRLFVDGKVRAHEIKVYTTWADFVFEADYKLPTLSEVENYINENEHSECRGS